MEAASAQAPLKIAEATIDSFFERLERVSQVEAELAASAELARPMARRLRATRSGLLDAPRQIGPPRPWGPPAASTARPESPAQALHAEPGNAQREGREE